MIKVFLLEELTLSQKRQQELALQTLRPETRMRELSRQPENGQRKLSRQPWNRPQGLSQQLLNQPREPSLQPQKLSGWPENRPQELSRRQPQELSLQFLLWTGNHWKLPLAPEPRSTQP